MRDGETAGLTGVRVAQLLGTHGFPRVLDTVAHETSWDVTVDLGQNERDAVGDAGFFDRWGAADHSVHFADEVRPVCLV